MKSKSTVLVSSSIGVLLLILCCGGGNLLGWLSDAGNPSAGPPTTGEWYQLYFTTPVYPDRAENRPARLPIMDGLVAAIDSAEETLDIAIYELNLPAVGAAILAAHERGVNVRLVTDSDELEELEVLIELEEAGIPIVGDERSALMHNKFVVVDGQAVWTGSWNFQPNDTYRNNNHAIYLRLPQLAVNYTTEFEEMFVDKAFGPTSPVNTPYPRLTIEGTPVVIETCFSPEDECVPQIVQALRQAEETIRFMAFSFTHDEIGQTLEQQVAEGIEVQGVFETRGSNTEYSEFGRLLRLGVDVLQDGNPYTLHHKVFIIDDVAVILGSFNFSQNAAESNDENMLIIYDPEIAGHFLTEFERVYDQALNPPN